MTVFRVHFRHTLGRDFADIEARSPDEARAKFEGRAPEALIDKVKVVKNPEGERVMEVRESGATTEEAIAALKRKWEGLSS